MDVNKTTNADLIRAMSDEDLAEFLVYTWDEFDTWQKEDYKKTLSWLRASDQNIGAYLYTIWLGHLMGNEIDEKQLYDAIYKAHLVISLLTSQLEDNQAANKMEPLLSEHAKQALDLLLKNGGDLQRECEIKEALSRRKLFKRARGLYTASLDELEKGGYIRRVQKFPSGRPVHYIELNHTLLKNLKQEE